MSGGPHYRKVHATEALMVWLGEMAEASDEVISQLPAGAVAAAQQSSAADWPPGQALYNMGWSDAMRHAQESVKKGLRMWVHPDTGEIVGVDVMGDPLPPGIPQP